MAHLTRALMNRGEEAMRPFKFSFFLFWFCCSLQVWESQAFGQQSEKIITVVATGVGTDSNTAVKNGIRAAVEQVVGAYISSETIVKNDMLLEDKIYSYSDGYVKEMKVIALRTRGELVYAKIEAKVVASELKRSLENLGMTIVRVEGESLFGEAISKIEQGENIEELLFAKLDRLKKSGLILEFGKIKILDPSRSKTKIEVPITVKWNQDSINDLYDTIRTVAKRKKENVHKSQCDTVCFTNTNLMSKDLISLTGIFGSLDQRGICDSRSIGNRAANLFNALYNVPVRVQIAMRDKDDRTVFAINKIENLSPQQFPRGYLCGICIGMDGITQMSLVDEINTDNLKDIVKMEGRVSFPDRDHK